MFVTSFINSRQLPLVVEPSDAKHSSLDTLVSLAANCREFFQNKILENGALLFRGFAVGAADEFARFARSFSGEELLDYAGGVSPRIELGGGVYTSTEYPSRFMLALHNEMSYAEKYPSRVYFCCQIAPETGGETPLADSRAILKKINKETVRQFKKRKIRYDRNLSGDAGSGFAWQDAFETADKRAVEILCRKSGVRFKWKTDGGLRLTQIRPATLLHPQTGEEVWFNQADGFHPSAIDTETYASLTSVMNEEDFRLNSYFGDGAPLDAAMLAHVRETIKNEMVVFPWRAGDVLVLDNLLTAHGRMPFAGARKIILAMT